MARQYDEMYRITAGMYAQQEQRQHLQPTTSGIIDSTLQHTPAYPNQYGPQSPVATQPTSSSLVYRNGLPPQPLPSVFKSNKQSIKRRDTGGGSSERSNRVTKRLSHAKPNHKVQVAIDQRRNMSDGKRVDCPVFKHHIMHNTMHKTSPPCQGCSVSVISQVRSHLDPKRAGTHRGFPSFIRCCSRCNEQFVEKDMHDNHIKEGCDPQPQDRGDRILAWGRLYLALYPDSQRIPVPCE
jgi:hypothetical protein